MKPVLIVEGQELEVFAVYYRENKVNSIVVINQDTSSVEYHDINEDTSYYQAQPLKIDFDKHLIWKNKNDDVINKIKKRIDSYEERMVELSFNYIKHTQPFADNVADKTEFVELEHKISGLEQALDILYGE